eukprot:scaffold278_cov82-Isochrysis_galbana.AAC.1
MRYGRAAAVAMLACNRARSFETALDIFHAVRTDAAGRRTQQQNPPQQQNPLQPQNAPEQENPPRKDTGQGGGGGGTDVAGAGDPILARAPPSASEALHNPLRSVAVFNAAVEAMRRQGMMEEAVELVVTMRERFGVPPDHATFGTALAGCREAGEPALVTALLEALFVEAEARERDAREDARVVAAGGQPRPWMQPLLPSDALHSELIGSFGRFGEPRRALRLFAQ